MQDSFEKSMETLIVGIYRDLERLEERMIGAGNLNMGISEMHMLAAVQTVGGEGGATVGELSEYLAIRPPSVTATINKLEGKGFVQRCKHPGDGRVVQVQLTRRGHKAELAHRYFHRTMVREIARELSEGEKATLMRSVTKLDRFLKGNIQKYER